MGRKRNFIFLTSMTLKIKVTTPKSTGFLKGLRKTYRPGRKLIAVKLFELSRGNKASLDGETDSAEGDISLTLRYRFQDTCTCTWSCNTIKLLHLWGNWITQNMRLIISHKFIHMKSGLISYFIKKVRLQFTWDNIWSSRVSAAGLQFTWMSFQSIHGCKTLLLISSRQLHCNVISGNQPTGNDNLYFYLWPTWQWFMDLHINELVSHTYPS